jgi:hypothetical protein
MSVFLLIGKTSALTMNVAGVLKDWLLIIVSVLMYKWVVGAWHSALWESSPAAVCVLAAVCVIDCGMHSGCGLRVGGVILQQQHRPELDAAGCLHPCSNHTSAVAPT